MSGVVVVVVVVVVALVTDLGRARLEQRRLQSAADAAALAGASDLNGVSGAPACVTAQDYLANNLRVSASAITGCGGQTAGGVRMTFTSPYTGGPVAMPPALKVNVSACDDVETIFARVIGIDRVQVCGRATARKILGSNDQLPAGSDVDTSCTTDASGQETCAPPPDCEPSKKDKSGSVTVCTTNPSGDPSVSADIQSLTCGSGAVVDGVKRSTDHYTKVGNLFVGTVDFGDIFFSCSDTAYFFAMVLNGPDNIGMVTSSNVANENVYGSATYHTTYNTGWPNDKHSFGDLLGSDRARFQVRCGSTPVYDFVQDYLIKTNKLNWPSATWASAASGDGAVTRGYKGPEQSSSSMVYNLSHPAATHWGDTVDENPTIQSPPFMSSYPNIDTGAYGDADSGGWVWDMTYEFSVSRAFFPSTCNGVRVALEPFDPNNPTKGGIHNSPAKVATAGSVYGNSDSSVQLVE